MTTLQKAQEALSAVQAEIADLEAQYEEASRGLGSLLARLRTGDKKAGTEAGRTSMKRVTLDGDLEKLRLEEAALLADIQAMKETQRTRAALETIPRFESINEEARELERQFAELITAAAEVGQQIRAIRAPFLKAKRAANAVGGTFHMDPPQYPSHLLPARVLNDPDTAVKRWLGPDQWREAAQLAALPKAPPRLKSVPHAANSSDQVLYRFTVPAEALGHSTSGGAA